MIPLGLQLWSLRKEFEQDAEGTLRGVPSLGIQAVELAGDYGWSADKWKTLLVETGLSVVGTHGGPDVFASEEKLAELLPFWKAIGSTRAILAWLPEELRSAEGYKKAAADLNKAAKFLAPHGIKVLYHNHDFEFADLGGGKNGYDILLAETDPALVSFEVDAYWVQYAGMDAYAFFSQHASRIGAVHAKEMKADKTQTAAGEGVVNFPSILSLAKGAEWPVVVEYEADDAPAVVKRSAAHLRGILDKMR